MPKIPEENCTKLALALEAILNAVAQATEKRIVARTSEAEADQIDSETQNGETIEEIVGTNNEEANK